jgi:hypothetical protein
MPSIDLKIVVACRKSKKGHDSVKIHARVLDLG